MAIEHEALIPLRQAAKLIPSTRGPAGKAIHIATMHRWITRGVRGQRLESVRIGGSRYTSVEAISRWIRELNPEAPHAASAPARDTARSRRTEQILREARLI